MSLLSGPLRSSPTKQPAKEVDRHYLTVNARQFFDCLDAKEKATLVHLLRKLTAFHDIQDVPIE